MVSTKHWFAACEAYLICRWGWPGTRRRSPWAEPAVSVPDPTALAGKWGHSTPALGIHSHALAATELQPRLQTRAGHRTSGNPLRISTDLSSFWVAPFLHHHIRDLILFNSLYMRLSFTKSSPPSAGCNRHFLSMASVALVTVVSSMDTCTGWQPITCTFTTV